MSLPPEVSIPVGVAQAIIARLFVNWAKGLKKDSRKDPTAPPFFAPPPPDADFMGRDREIDAVVQGLKRDQPVLLWGMPGVGKSSIALAVVHTPDVQNLFGSRILWVTAHDDSLDGLCSKILRQMGAAEALKNLPSAEEKASVLRGALKQANVGVLFVLDQADNAPGARDFCRSVTPHTLVTSQDSMSDMLRVEVDTFPDDSLLAGHLIEAKAPRDLTLQERDLLPAVARQCGYLAQALVMAGGQLLEGYTLQELSRAMTKHGLDPLVDTVDPTRSVRATLDIAYDRLTPPLKRLFACFGVFNLLEAPVGADAVLAAYGEGERQDVNLLAARSLVTAVRGEAGRYTMHSLLWRYACEKVGDDPAPRVRALDYFTKVAEKHGKEGWQHYREMDAALPHLFFLLRWAREHSDHDVSLQGVVLMHAIPEFLDRRGYWTERVEWGQWALDIARATGNNVLTGLSAHHMAIALQRRGEVAQARRLYEENLTLAREMGNKIGIAVTLYQLGALAYDQGDYARARKLNDESLKLNRELGSKQGIAATLHQMGMLALAQNPDDYAGARTLYEESLALARELGNKSGIASTLHQLGMLAQDQGDYAGAREKYDESLKIKQKMGDKRGVAATLGQLGNLACSQGDYAGARTQYEEVLDVFRELGDKSGIAISLHQLGVLAEIEKRPGEAADYFRQALAILTELKSPDAETARRSLERVKGASGKDKP